MGFRDLFRSHPKPHTTPVHNVQTLVHNVQTPVVYQKPPYADALRCGTWKQLSPSSAYSTRYGQTAYYSHPNFESLETGAAHACELCRLFRQALLYQCSNVSDEEALRHCPWPVKVEVTRGTGSVRLWIQDPVTGVLSPPRVLVTAPFSKVPEAPGIKPQLRAGEGGTLRGTRYVLSVCRTATGLHVTAGVDPSFDLMSHWITTCLQQHNACSQNGQASPLRPA